MPDAFLLYQLASRSDPPGRAVEVGSAWGRSTVFLAAGSRRAVGNRVLAIDPHTGDDLYLADEGLGPMNSYAEFLANLERLGVSEWVEPVVATSADAAASVPREPIRLLFIDGVHTYEGVRDDIEAWVPRVSPGGFVVFDDYPNPDPRVGVRAAVDDLLSSGLVEPTLHQAFNLVWTRRAG